MTLIDDQGRLFGRVNLIDAAVVVFVVALVPLAYASWVLFRIPPPVITSIAPTVVRPDEEGQMIVLQGQYLRPGLRVFISGGPAAYLFASPTQAEVRLPRLAPGSVDLALFDEARELSRHPNALTVEPLPPPSISSISALPGPSGRQPQILELRGQHLRASLVAFVGEQPAPYQFEPPDRAELRLPELNPGVYNLTLVGKDDTTRKELMRYAEALTVAELELVIRAVIRPEVAATLKREAASATAVPSTTRPVLVSCQVTDQLAGTTFPDLKEGRVSIIMATVRVAAVKTTDGWQHNGRLLRAGDRFRLEAQSFAFEGEILTLGNSPERSR